MEEKKNIYFSYLGIWQNLEMLCKIVWKFELGRPIKCNRWSSMRAWVTGFTLSLIELKNIYYVDLSQVDVTQMNFSRGFPAIEKRCLLSSSRTQFSLLFLDSGLDQRLHLTVTISINFHSKSINSFWLDSIRFSVRFVWLLLILPQFTLFWCIVRAPVKQ